MYCILFAETPYTNMIRIFDKTNESKLDVDEDFFHSLYNVHYCFTIATDRFLSADGGITAVLHFRPSSWANFKPPIKVETKY